MKSSRTRRRLLLICTVFVLVFTGIFVGTLYQHIRQQRLDNALIAAVKRYDADAVDAALQQGANPNARDNANASPTLWQALTYWLHHRAMPIPSGNPALSVVLSPETHPNYGRGRHIVAHDSRIAQALLQAGANPDAPDKNGSPPLVVACTGCPPEDVRVLLTHHARIEARDKYGRTGLIYAASSNEPAVVPLLLERGAEVNTRDIGGETPLMMASVMNSVSTAQRLLAHHADISATDRAGNTALSYAKRDKHAAIIRLLVQCGAK